MHQENGIYNFPLRLCKDIAVRDTIEVGGLELDPRISWGDFVNHLEAIDRSEELTEGNRKTL